MNSLSIVLWLAVFVGSQPTPTERGVHFALQAGAGEGTRPVCAESHVCGGLSGTLVFTTGPKVPPAPADLLRIKFTDPPELYSCTVTVQPTFGSKASRMPVISFKPSDVDELDVMVSEPLEANIKYQVVYICNAYRPRGHQRSIDIAEVRR